MGAIMLLSDRIGSRMKLQNLHVLITVVQSGSMGKAAQRLNTTQPNISRSIGELEHALGVQLLDRTRAAVDSAESSQAAAASVETLIEFAASVIGVLTRAILDE